MVGQNCLRAVRMVLISGGVALTPKLAMAKPSVEFKHCYDFMMEAKYTKSLQRFASAFSLEPTGQIIGEVAVAKKAQLTVHPGKSNYHFEFNDLRQELMAGLQIDDLGGDPREFALTENSIENPMGAGGKPVIMKLYRYTFSLRNGLCLPIGVHRVDSTGEVKVFDFDQCLAAKERGAKLLPSVDCSGMPNFEAARKDSRFTHVLPERSGSAGSTFRSAQ